MTRHSRQTDPSARPTGTPNGRRRWTRRVLKPGYSQRCLAAVTVLLAGQWSVVVPSGLAGSDAAGESSAIQEYPITADDREHWSFAPLQRPALPVVQHRQWVRNPIDRFILAALEWQGLLPQDEADRETLIRRLTFDLTGLPPTPEQIDQFLGDSAPDAYERLVARLLACSQYGERWAQHWLDLARFAETDGFEHDKLRPQAWRYRDWVIDALNRDVPFDRFVQLQIAADELAPDDAAAAVATAFCLSGPDMPDINSQQERRHHLLNELTATVGSALLGLQLGCAQCHDHKYDPISQADFYRLRAIFEPAVHVQKNQSVSVLKEGSSPLPPSYLMIRGDWRRRGPQVQPAFPRIANPWNEAVPSHVLAGATSGRRAALARWLTRGDHPLTTRVIANRIWQHHFGRGLSSSPSDFGLMGQPPSHAQLLDWLACELVRRNWSMKRLHWLIVTSATYRQASDWQASGAPRDSASTRARRRGAEVDRENQWYSRFPRRRLEGEAVRDAMLQAAGMLNRRQGGAGVMPPLPQELLGTLLKNQWKVSPREAEHYRRSVYLFARRNLRYPVFEVFDRPDANASCPQRNRSTTAVQSLLMLNSAFSLTTARQMAGDLLRRAPDAEEQITLAFRRTLARRPSPAERDLAREFLAGQQQLLRRQAGQRQLALPIPKHDAVDPYAAAALSDLCLALFNTSEFIYID